MFVVFSNQQLVTDIERREAELQQLIANREKASGGNLSDQDKETQRLLTQLKELKEQAIEKRDKAWDEQRIAESAKQQPQHVEESISPQQEVEQLTLQIQQAQTVLQAALSSTSDGDPKITLDRRNVGHW